MQTLKVGSYDTVIFFDPRANVNLINGDLAQRVGLSVISDKPQALSVVGGGLIQTEYGLYDLRIGDSTSGVYHQVSCLGMTDVTTSFPEYDLTKIIAEFHQSCPEADHSSPLPPCIRGSQVDILVGIRNTALIPTLITILPSGVGVFQSKLWDIYGSNIIFAGPHKSFSTGNGRTRMVPNQTMFMLDHADDIYDQGEEQHSGELPKQIHYSLPAYKELGMSMHPHALNQQDFTDAGCVIPEELVDKGDPGLFSTLMKTVNHFCSVHKASIPMSHIRELIDQDDCNDLITYRCPDCSKCVKCKTSTRKNAISLQESREQDLISRSVAIDRSQNKVIVQFPFLKCPGSTSG